MVRLDRDRPRCFDRILRYPDAVPMPPAPARGIGHRRPDFAMRLAGFVPIQMGRALRDKAHAVERPKHPAVGRRVDKAAVELDTEYPVQIVHDSGLADPERRAKIRDPGWLPGNDLANPIERSLHQRAQRPDAAADRLDQQHLQPPFKPGSSDASSTRSSRARRASWIAWAAAKPSPTASPKPNAVATAASTPSSIRRCAVAGMVANAIWPSALLSPAAASRPTLRIAVYALALGIAVRRTACPRDARRGETDRGIKPSERRFRLGVVDRGRRQADPDPVLDEFRHAGVLGGGQAARPHRLNP